MKIERVSVTITDIPYFDRILITPTSIDLDRDGPIDYATEEIEAIRDALTEAIRIKREIDGESAPPRVFRLGDAGVRPRGHRNEPAESAPPRVFHENDLEPGPEITKVVDVDSLDWYRVPGGWNTHKDGRLNPWVELLKYVPLVEVRDA